MDAADIVDSVNTFEKEIAKSQIIMFPGGFSAGDEPDGSAKFFATAFQNAKLKEAVEKLLNERDGLVLGICNGFQTLVKLGLVPYGEVVGQTPDSPTLTYNTIGRHISKMVYTKVVTNKSPWLQGQSLAEFIPIRHPTERDVLLQVKNGLTSSLQTDRLQHSTVTLTEMYLWTKNGTSMALIAQLKVLQVRMAVCLVRWHIQNVVQIPWQSIFMVSRI